MWWKKESNKVLIASRSHRLRVDTITSGTLKPTVTPSLLLSLLLPSSGDFPTVPPTRVGLRSGSGIPTLTDLAPPNWVLCSWRCGPPAMFRYLGNCDGQGRTFATLSFHGGKGRATSASRRAFRGAVDNLSAHGWLIAPVRSLTHMPRMSRPHPMGSSFKRESQVIQPLGVRRNHPSASLPFILLTPPSRKRTSCDRAFFPPLFFRLCTDLFPHSIPLSLSVPPTLFFWSSL